ncbi:MAG: phosphoglucosamine mutase, partial [Mycobacteriales bacterium]
EVVQTAVGDRYVLEAMRARDLALGGEQSGHVVFADRSTTGDGLLTGLAVMSRMAATRSSLADLAAVMTRLPQVLLNVPVRDRRVATHPDVIAVAERVHRTLGDTGRVLLRPSGTEPIVRVMVEAPTQHEAQSSAAAVADAVRRATAPA